ncbi:hypothetical protein P3G55_22895 [Leptospira sp. 96542]|nr:hypothetical protein [Leptospira sp. 96542]
MPNILKTVFFVILGLLIGSAVNFSLIMVSGQIIPPPMGADITTMEGLKNSIHLFEPKHFLFPFLAHALGTFVGASIATRFVSEEPLKYALVIGIFFLVGGISNSVSIPSPVWFVILDLGLAYIPMSYFAYQMFGIKNSKH